MGDGGVWSIAARREGGAVGPRRQIAAHLHGVDEIGSTAVQEGDGELFVQSNDGRIVKSFPRGYNLQFTEDNQFLVFKIKPLYKDTRQARIKKKKPEDFPKDTLAYLELGKDTATKVARVKSYKLPEKSGGWLAFLMEKPIADSSKSKKDSLSHKLDSLIRKQPMISAEKKKDELDADGDAADASKTEEGTDLVVVQLTSRQNNLFKNISEYYWSKPGNILLMKGTPAKKDSLGKNLVAIWRSHENHTDTISRGGSDFKNFTNSGIGEMETIRQACSSTRCRRA